MPTRTTSTSDHRPPSVRRRGCAAVSYRPAAQPRSYPAGRCVMTFTPPPLHPILVNFTAALLPASFLSDLLGVVLRKEALKSAGWWTLLYAATVTPVTAVAGWLWMRSMGDMDHSEMSVHKWLGTALA